MLSLNMALYLGHPLTPIPGLTARMTLTSEIEL